MIYIEKDKLNIDDFIVLDESDSPVIGLIKSNFIIKLFNPDGDEVADTEINIGFLEIGNGIYRLTFIPVDLGNYSLLIYNNTYFPFGKGESYNCIENVGISNELKAEIKRTLGLVQENYRIFNPSYDKNNNMLNGIIKIYPTANDCENNTNEIAEYQITATYDVKNRMTGYKVIKL